MAENTHPQIKDKIEEMLVSKERFEPEKAKEVMDSTWTDTPEDMAIKLTANVPLLFQRLKNEGVKVRIFTSYVVGCIDQSCILQSFGEGKNSKKIVHL